MSYTNQLFGINEGGGSREPANRRLAWKRIPQVLDVGIGWCALSLIVLVAVPNGSEKIWWQAAFESAVFGLGALWILNGFFRGNWPLNEASFFVPLILLAAYAIFQTLPILPEGTRPFPHTQGLHSISADTAGTYRFIAELLALTILGKLLLDFTRDRRSLSWLVYVVIGICAASALFGMIRLMTQNTSSDPVLADPSQAIGFAQFANRNHFALMLEMGLGLTLGAVLVRGLDRNVLVLHIGLALLLASTIVFTTSRGGVLAMLGQMLFVAVWFVVQTVWRRKSSQRKRRLSGLQYVGKVTLSVILISALALAIVIGIVSLGGDKLASRMEKLPGEWGNQGENTPVERGDIWRATWKLIEDNPVSGAGFGAYETVIPKYLDASGKATPASALNEYLNLLAGGGAIGTGLAIWFMIILALRIRENLKSKIRFERAASVGAIAGFFGVAVHSFVDSGLQVPINAVLFFALIVIAISDTGTKAVDPAHQG